MTTSTSDASFFPFALLGLDRWAGGTMAMRKQVWGDEFGMCVDRFGISWLVNIGQPQL